MNIYMKIHEYREESMSLIVSFASDETKSKNPDDYPALAFQPSSMYPGVTDINEIKKRIATAGIYQTQLQSAQEKFSVDTDAINALKSLVGQTSSFVVSDLQPSNVVNDSVTTV
jgi:hypothetical protein